MKINSSCPFFIFCIAILAIWAPGFGKSFTIPLDTIQDRELEIDLDPYYSALDLIFSIDSNPIPKFDPNEEMGTYSYLFWNMAKPRFGLLEISFNPLPFSGAMIHDHSSSVYRKADFGDGSVNGINALTTGFPEPWAVSYFLGNVVDLMQSDTAAQSYGRGFGGALLSLGNYHIVSNHFVEDYWAEGELKLKGTISNPSRHMSWSFRVGGKVHSHPEIYNTLYFSIKRDRVDLKEPSGWTLKTLIIRNSEVEARADIRIPRDVQLWNYFTRFSLLAGKKWPSASGNWAFSLGIGAQLDLKSGYRGELDATVPKQLWSLMLRPNVIF